MARKKVARKPSIERTLLVDHDIIVFLYASTCEFVAHWTPEISTTTIQLERAKYQIMQRIDALMKRCSCTKSKLFMTGSFNFRYGVLPSYKHNRVDTVRPAALGDLRDWSEEVYDCQITKGFEADDLLGIYGSKYPETTVVATIDKDLKCVPCKLYLWNHDTLGLVSIADADYNFYFQVLIGDSTDGYTGCPGVGAKAAEKFLAEHRKKHWWPEIVKLYEKALCKAEIGVDNPKLKPKTRLTHCKTIDLYAVAGGVYEYALQQARVARICRWEDHNPKTMEVIYWNPPNASQLANEET